MIPDLNFVKETFDRYNALIFEGKLPPVRIVMGRGQRYLGKMEYRTVKGIFGTTRGHDNFLMRISTARDMPTDQWEDVIIHEMIHYYIACFNLKDRSAHGPLFRSMMKDINERFGRHIVISHKLTEPDPCIRTHIVCVCLMPGGHYGISVFNPGSQLSSLLSTLPASPGGTAISNFSSPAGTTTSESGGRASARGLSIAEKCIPALPRLYNVREIRIYATTNPFFNRYPHSRSPKIYKVSTAELLPALDSATPLHFTGRFLSA